MVHKDMVRKRYGYRDIVRVASLLLCALSFPLCVEAEDEFVHLDWSSVDLSNGLPEYCKTVEVGAYESGTTYRVWVEYPEFAEMTKTESEMLDLLRADIGEEVTIETHLGVSRKVGLLDVVIVPVVKREGKYLKLLSCKVNIESETGGMARSSSYVQDEVATVTAESSRYKSHSVLREGTWVKIRVSEEGVYQMSRSFLSGLGFSDMDRVKVFGYGGRVQNHAISYGTYTTSDFDDLEEIPLYRRDDALLFFADGTVRWSSWTLSTRSDPTSVCSATHTNNPYSSYSYYFVTEGDDPLAMEVLESPESTTQTFTTYPEHLVIETDAYSWYTGGRSFYDSYDYANGNSVDYILETPDIDSTCMTQIVVSFSASATTVTSARVTLGGTTLGTLNMGALSSEYDKATTSSSTYSTRMSGTSNTLNITTTNGNNARLDYIRVCYRRQLRLRDDYLVFSHYSALASTMELQGATADTEVWCIGYPSNPAAKVAGTLSGSTLTFSVTNPSLRYVAVKTSATFPSPERVGKIANQDLHADSVYDMVIIVPESGKLTEQAQRLADLHEEHDSLRVKVVRADELYNEFSSGTPGGGAYRRYLKMLYDRNTGDDLPKYLLLFGGCVWDNRGVTSACSSLDFEDYLLCYESEASVSEVSCYVNEDYFGMLDDDEGSNLRYDKVDLGVGRFPVTEVSDAKIIVDKVIAYVNNENPGSWKNSIYFLADDGDSNKHVREADEAADNVEEYYPNIKVGKIYWDAYTRVSTATGFTYPQVTSDIKDVMTKGALVMNYTGHGACYTISGEQVLKTEDFKEFSSAKVPMWVIASCEITPFDREEENIGVEAMVNPNGAAIAMLSSSRAVYSTQNSYINNYYMNYLLGKSDGKRNTIGDALRLAKVNLVSSVEGEIMSTRDYSDNKLKYAVMGDPAMVLSMPTQSVVLDSINGVALGGEEVPNLSAGSVARFSGHLEDEDGVALSDYYGQVSVTLYDSEDTITCKNNTGEDDGGYVYRTYDRLLFEGNDSVKAGQFSVVMPIPLDIKSTGARGMVMLYAVITTKTLEANGTDKRFTVGGTSEDYTAGSEGPTIFAYLNDPDFRDGGTVNSTPYFYANLSDSDGINITGNNVGHDLELIIDGNENTTYNLNAYYENDFGSYTSGSVSYMIPELEDGEHTLFFRAWDVLNNSSSTSLNFVVDSSLRPSITSVTLSNNPASTSTTFIISYDRPSTETTFTIDVYNIWGQHCWTHTETATTNGYHTITWDLSTNGGVALQTGLYIYKVAISCEGTSETTKKQKMIIFRQ